MSIVNRDGQRVPSDKVIAFYMESLMERIKGKVRLEADAPETVIEVLHRVSINDAVSSRRVQMFARQIRDYSGGVIQMGLARTLVARALGYSDFYHARAVNKDSGPYRNQRNKRPLGVKREIDEEQLFSDGSCAGSCEQFRNASAIRDGVARESSAGHA